LWSPSFAVAILVLLEVTQLIQPSGEATGITEQGHTAVLTRAAGDGAAGSATIQRLQGQCLVDDERD
jgi:hypothetical protein